MNQTNVCSPATIYTPELLAQMMPEDWANILCYRQVIDGVTISRLDGRPVTNWHIYGKTDASFGIVVFIEGTCNMALDGSKPLTIKPGTVALYSYDKVLCGWDDFKGRQNLKVIDIRFTLEALTKLSGQPIPNLSGTLQQDVSIPERQVYFGTVPIWHDISRVAVDILKCPIEAADSGLYLQAKAMEALALTLKKINYKRPTHTLPAPADRNKVQHTHAWIQQNFATPTTVKKLARQAGLSEKRLQAGFQSLYGHSVHDSINQIRMEEAANVLQKGCNVTEAAMTVGYSSLSHFIKNFKEYWGATPKNWLRS